MHRQRNRNLNRFFILLATVVTALAVQAVARRRALPRRRWRRRDAVRPTPAPGGLVPFLQGPLQRARHTNFVNVYRNALGTRLDDCQTCHKGGTFTYESSGKTRTAEKKRLRLLFTSSSTRPATPTTSLSPSRLPRPQTPYRHGLQQWGSLARGAARYRQQGQRRRRRQQRRLRCRPEVPRRSGEQARPTERADEDLHHRAAAGAGRPQRVSCCR